MRDKVKRVGVAFIKVVREATVPELITLQHDLRSFQPEDKDYLKLVLLELKNRYKEKKGDIKNEE